MASLSESRAVVIGSGPNGLAAAIELARAGAKVTVFEAAAEIGGAVRSEELTLPGFVHDVGSAIHPLAACSPCFERYPLAEHGLKWVHPEAPVAHPLDNGTVMLERSLDDTAAGLGEDGARWRSLFGPLVEAWPELRHDVLAPIGMPRHPLEMARLGLRAIRSARGLAEGYFKGARARALFGGIAAHSALPLETAGSAGMAMVLAAVGHASGWPFPRGGAGRLSGALAGVLRGLGGEIVTNSVITSLPEAAIIMCDLTPRQFLRLGGVRIPDSYRRALERYRYGSGAFKMDWALDGPIPWRAPECARAGTVHLGGTLEEMAQYEAGYTGRPFVILAQHTLFDATRAPRGKHTAWAYCHVPNGSGVDMTGAIEEQVERFAPGFGSRILGRSVLPPAALERWNANLIGGDFAAGAVDLRQLVMRPTLRRYRTPMRGVYFCGASTPPGPGVHGMCGFHAARVAGVMR